METDCKLGLRIEVRLWWSLLETGLPALMTLCLSGRRLRRLSLAGGFPSKGNRVSLAAATYKCHGVNEDAP